MPSRTMERRATPRPRGGIRVAVKADGAKTIRARVLVYGVTDDYRSRWKPGVFTEGLRSKLPAYVWAHDWRSPIGRAIDYKDDRRALDMLFELDDFEDVPLARQAYAQAKSGTAAEFSVGFLRLEWRELDAAQNDGAVEEITKARLDEVSQTIAGAVPGTELLDVRSRSGRGAQTRTRPGRATPRVVSEVDRILESVERLQSMERSPHPSFASKRPGHLRALRQALRADVQRLSVVEQRDLQVQARKRGLTLPR